MLNKLTLYKHLIQSLMDENSFIETDHCDSLLFSGLVGSVTGKVDIWAAYDQDTGQWHRRPTKDCFPEHSKSTISRDMLIGVLYYAWRNKDLEMSESVVQYALSNWGIMGQASTTKVLFGRCMITPGLLSTAAWVSYKLGGPSRAWLRWIPTGVGSSSVDFKAHLAVLHGLLRDELEGRCTHLRQYKSYVKRQPTNPLFLYAAGYPKEARDMLMNEKWWPNDRLPTTQDRRSGWLLERDYGPDWQPQSGTVKTHSGADFIVVASLLLEKS